MAVYPTRRYTMKRIPVIYDPHAYNLDDYE